MDIAEFLWVNIARLFKVSTVTVLKWVKYAVAQINPLDKVDDPEVVIIDEFWYFVNGKKLFGCGEPLMGYSVRLLGDTWALVLMPVESLCKKLIPENAHL